MKAKVAILSAALAVLGGGAIHLWRQLDASRQQAAGLQPQVDTAASVRQAATIAPSPSLPLAEPTAATPAPNAVSEASEESLAAALASPESKAKVKAVMIGNMSIQYPDVGKVLGLSRQEVDRLFDLLYEQLNRAPMDPMRDGAWEDRARTDNDELASLLGSKYAKYQEYRAELPTRLQVKDLGAALDSAGTPLSDAQSNSLIPALAAVERRNSQERVATPEQAPTHPLAARYYRFTPEASRNLLNEAAAHLTPQQLETYSQVLERASAQETQARNRLNQVQKNLEAARQGRP